MALVQEFEHLKLSLDVIKLATNSFGSDHFIGVGGFGKVYKGEIPDSEGRPITVAIKRLDRKHGQGEHEFLTEIMMLSRYRHKNLVSLTGFCDEAGEKILVYEYELNGSLEKYLNNKTLTWAQRLKICVGAARGLEYLHNPLGTQQRVLHRDVKSANILLDQLWEAKVSDFGLSKIGPANQEFTFLVSNAVGTLGYCDPLYAETGILTKESDVYSFGVVLFEVLCGRSCILKHGDERDRLLTQLAQTSYEEGTLDKIIFGCLQAQMEPRSLEKFASTAYQCLRRDRKQRPTMAQVLGNLELALEYQESYESGKPMEYEDIINMVDREHPLVYTNERELKLLLSSGILVDWGRRWFSLSKSGHNCEMISASQFSFQYPHLIEWIPHPKSRFSEVAIMKNPRVLNIDVEIETYFLSPGITYAAYLVFKYCDDSDREEEEEGEDVPLEPTFVGLQYKLKAIQYNEGYASVNYLADRANDGWMLVELCQFVSYKKSEKFEVFLQYLIDYNDIFLEGLQFLPVDDPVDDEPIHEVENAHTLDTYREQKLPDDYREIIKMAKDKVPHKITDKDLYARLSNGILTDRGQSFFYLDKSGLKCCMQAAVTVLERKDCFRIVSTDQSRFETVAECVSGNQLFMQLHINSHMLSPNTTYATYLVYMFPETSHWAFDSPLEVKVPHKVRSRHNNGPFTFLTIPTTEVINLVQDDGDHEREYHMNPMNRPKLQVNPRQRKDGWMETLIWAFRTDAPAETIYKEFLLSFCDKQEFTGLIMQGVEIRPKKL